MSTRDNWEMQCPQCGDDTDLRIDAVQAVTVSLCEDGTDDEGGHGDIKWGNNDSAYCHTCDWFGTVGQMERAYSRAKQAAEDAVGREVTGDEIGEALDAHNTTPLTDLKAALKAKRQQLADAGGRGVELADEIDCLEVAVAVKATFKKPRQVRKAPPSTLIAELKQKHAAAVAAVAKETDPLKQERLRRKAFKLRDQLYGKRCN